MNSNSVPEYSIPEYSIPEYSVSNFSIPEYSVSNFSIPEYSVSQNSVQQYPMQINPMQINPMQINPMQINPMQINPMQINQISNVQIPNIINIKIELITDIILDEMSNILDKIENTNTICLMTNQDIRLFLQYLLNYDYKTEFSNINQSLSSAEKPQILQLEQFLLMILQYLKTTTPSNLVIAISSFITGILASININPSKISSLPSVSEILKIPPSSNPSNSLSPIILQQKLELLLGVISLEMNNILNKLNDPSIICLITNNDVREFLKHVLEYDYNSQLNLYHKFVIPSEEKNFNQFRLFLLQLQKYLLTKIPPYIINENKTPTFSSIEGPTLPLVINTYNTITNFLDKLHKRKKLYRPSSPFNNLFNTTTIIIILCTVIVILLLLFIFKR